MSEAPSDITQILKAAQEGDKKAAEELLPLVYAELRRMAASKMAREAPNQTLQPTALVHEAWLRLTGDENRKWEGRNHFFAAAAESMRRILIDKARSKAAVKHGGGMQRVDLEKVTLASETEDTQLLAINDALEELAQERPQCAEVVKLKYFVGMTDKECGEVLGLAERTVKRYWAFAKASLYDQLGSSTFSARDLLDLSSLASKLKQPSRAFDILLAGKLSSSTQEALRNYQGQGSDPNSLQQALIEDLNRILDGDAFYSQESFAGVALRQKTQTLMAQKPQESNVKRLLNRLLIEDAYPLEVSRNHRPQAR